MVLAREVLYRLEPELYDQVASAERLRSEVVGWLPRHVRPRDAMTAGPPPVPGETSLPRVYPGFTGLFLAGYDRIDPVARLRRAGAGSHNLDTGLGVVVSGSRPGAVPVVLAAAGRGLSGPVIWTSREARVSAHAQPGGTARGGVPGR